MTASSKSMHLVPVKGLLGMVFMLCFLTTTALFAQKKVYLKNAAYSIEASIKSIQINRVGQAQTSRLSPELTVFFSDKEKVAYKRVRTQAGRSSIASWDDETDFWKSAPFVEMKAKKMTQLAEGKVRFEMKETENFSLRLHVELPGGSSVPVISWELTPKVAGWFSCGFTGLPSYQADQLDFLYQPLVWTWKRFPEKAFLTPEAYATTGASFVSINNITEGLHVHPQEVPFRYAKFGNSRFGIALRTREGEAKPMIFAPILRGSESRMQAGETYQFVVRYFMQSGDWQEGAAYLYNEVIQYRKERENATVSLNKTLENMLDFAMDDEYSGWVKDWKGHDYLQDVPGTVKNVSALHPLSLALTTGSREIYRKRALPMMEYMMSRQKYLFGVDTTVKYQSPSMYLKGPCAEIGELSGLHQMTNFQNDAFLEEIDRLFGKARMLNLTTKTKSDSWQDYLARYKITKDASLLAKARELADEYIQNYVWKYPTDFNSTPGLKDRQAYFVTDFGIRWFDLVELYEVTKAQKYLDAAELGAMEMLLWTRSLPFSHPDSTFTFNKGGKVNMFATNDPYNHIKKGGITSPQEKENFDPITPLSEQEVPAWRASFVGLIPESSYTYHLGSISLTHYAPWMLRVAQLTDNKVLANAAYNAVIGRYANYPGYYLNTFDSNIYQRADYPMKRFRDMRYNAIFYNHVWPQIALVHDFIITDAFYKSDGLVDFPSVYAPGYAFLTSKVYGHAAGKIYDNEHVNLWLPRASFFTTEIALNHLWGRDEANTYLVLMNTSNEAVSTTLYVNPEVVPWHSSKSYEVVYYQKDGTMSKGIFQNGRLTVEVPANGIQTIKLVDLKSEVPFQITDKPETQAKFTTAEGFFRKEHQEKSLGTLTGMRLKMLDFDNIYLYTDATAAEVAKVVLAYKVGEYEWESAEDITYPYEFSIPVFAKDAKVKVKWKAINKDGKEQETETFVLGL